MLVTRRSTLTGRMHSLEIDLTPEQFAELELPKQQRRGVQEIVPALPVAMREFLISGVTPTEWARFVGTDNSED